MLTVVLGSVAVLVLIGVMLLVMRSGNSGGRNGQSGRSVARQQVDDKRARGGVRTSGSAND